MKHQRGGKFQQRGGRHVSSDKTRQDRRPKYKKPVEVEKVQIVDHLLRSQKQFKRAEELYNMKVNQHQKETGKNRDREYFDKMTREGTANDKINAHAELIKMYPEVSL